MGVTELHQILGENETVIALPEFVLDVRHVAFCRSDSCFYATDRAL